MIVGPAGEARPRLERSQIGRVVAAQPSISRSSVAGLRDKAIQTEMVAFRRLFRVVGHIFASSRASSRRARRGRRPPA